MSDSKWIQKRDAVTNLQHPDHDTAIWPPKPALDAEPWRPKEEGV
ncbi:MAG: hypothetical protein RLZZ444_4497 [Pseudomonadota bacterium]